MTDATTRVRVRAPAKINLTLRVLGTRPDGYRELRTIFQSLALHDTLTFSAVRRRGLSRAVEPLTIACDRPDCPTDGTNLVARAADLLWREAGRRGQPPGVHVRIQKRIPMQAGLGGGSSDAAAALRALSVLWRLRVPQARLADIARALGADVAFFLEGGTVLGVERGDVLFPLVDRPAADVVLVLPDFGVSTRDAYAWWQDAADTRQAIPGRTDTEWVNDLEPPVAARHPPITQFVAELRRAGASYAAMSGSGSAVFGLFDRPAAVATAVRRLSGAGRTIVATKTVDRRRYQRVVQPR